MSHSCQQLFKYIVCIRQNAPRGAHFPMTTNDTTAETRSYFVKVYDLASPVLTHSSGSGPVVYAQGTKPTSLLHVGKRDLLSIAADQQVMVEFDSVQEHVQDSIQRVLTGPRVLTEHFAIDDMTLWSKKRVASYKELQKKRKFVPDDPSYFFEIGGSELVAWHEQNQAVNGKLEYTIHMYARNPRDLDILCAFVHESAHHKTGTASDIAVGISYLREAVQEYGKVPVDWCENKKALEYLLDAPLPQLSRTLHQVTLKWNIADSLRLIKNALRLAEFDVAQLRTIRLESFL